MAKTLLNPIISISLVLNTPSMTKRTLVGAWCAQLEDIYHQQFYQIIHSQPVGNVVLGANLGRR